MRIERLIAGLAITRLAITRLACGLALVAALALPALGAEPMETLHLSYPLANAFYWDFDVARAKGFFKDENFAIAYTTAMSTPQGIQMLVSGDLQLVTPQPDALLVAMTRGGSDLAVIGQPALEPDWILVGRKGIKGFPDLKGATLGVSALGGSEQSLAQQVLAEHGLKKGDFNVIVSGLTPSKFAALQIGSIAMAVLYQPTAQLALSQGFPALYRFAGLLPAYPPSYYAVSRKWAAQKDHGARIVRVLMRAHRWLWDPKNRAEAIAILKTYTKRSDAILGQIYDQYFVTDKLYSPDGKVQLKGVQTIIDDMVARGELKTGAITPQQVALPVAVGTASP
jgi:ABC-type nitrate/sulfonate/bicarbonate transport system substrate-binding protein